MAQIESSPSGIQTNLTNSKCSRNGDKIELNPTQIFFTNRQKKTCLNLPLKGCLFGLFDILCYLHDGLLGCMNFLLDNIGGCVGFVRAYSEFILNLVNEKCERKWENV